jgi:hypothetical protein
LPSPVGLFAEEQAQGGDAELGGFDPEQVAAVRDEVERALPETGNCLSDLGDGGNPVRLAPDNELTGISNRESRSSKTPGVKVESRSSPTSGDEEPARRNM